MESHPHPPLPPIKPRILREDEAEEFLYVGDTREYEDLTRYKRYGLHPVLLHDVLPKPSTCVSDLNKEPRYRIMLKLGQGAFATVWLARDIVEKRYVAVKVCSGSNTPHLTREATILSQLHKTGTGKRGHQTIIHLFDVFTIHGPNGFHDCLVTEVVCPLKDGDTRAQCSYDVVRQLVEGFAFLHGEGIVHGDPHYGNFGIAVPQLQQFEEDEIREHFANPQAFPVIPLDHSKFPSESLPPYVVASEELGWFLRTNKALPAASAMSIKIFDFGRAYDLSKPVPDLEGAAPLYVRPPEVALVELRDGVVSSAWSEAADIWALACVLHCIQPGGELISTMGYLKDYMFCCVKFGGPPPEDWPQLWNVPDQNFDASNPDHRHQAWLAEMHRESKWRPRTEERDDFLNFIKKMVITDPAERPRLEELLTDTFMARGTDDEGVQKTASLTD